MRTEEGRALPWFLSQLLPSELKGHVIALAQTLVDNPPDVLHAWLDDPNLIAAAAGVLAGVPHIILSTRNVNPTHFPRFHLPYFHHWYQTFARSSRVHFIANSHAGAASYAEWIGVPVERFHVVFNGICLDHFPKPTTEARRKARASFGLDETAPVVCGVFRLADEKQPFLFLDIIRRVKERLPWLKVLLSGEGDLATSVEAEIRATGLRDCVWLLGRRTDVANVYLASDVCLLTSAQEGCPNVALESQHLETPMVATQAGGTADAVLHGVTGFLAGVNDAPALAAHVLRMLTDETMRARMGAAGPGFVASRFGLERMVEQSQAVYEVAINGGRGERVLPAPLQSAA
jgi:glycosyltransferase involved in cell wall biosynthesis